MTSAATIIGKEQTKLLPCFLGAVRQAAKNGSKRLISVVDDYEYDSSRLSSGPRKATALIGLRVRVECLFMLPVSDMPEVCSVRIDTTRGGGCWFRGQGVEDEDSEDVMRLAFEDRDKLLSALVLEKLIGHYSFRTLHGLGVLSKRYRADDFAYRATPAGLMVSFVAEMEAY